MGLMNDFLWFFIAWGFIIGAAQCASLRDYIAERERVTAEESRRVLGSDLELNANETLVNDILLSAKRREFERGLEETFPPSVNFLTNRHLVEQSEVFDIIRRMPKGGILHTHDSSIADPAWIVQHITYLPDLYYCLYDVPGYTVIRFRFSTNHPGDTLPECRTDWLSVAETRKEVGAEHFDQTLFNNLTMFTPNPAEAYPNFTAAWYRFLPALLASADLFLNNHTFEPMVKRAFQQMVDDNVQFVELRIGAPLRNLDGTMNPKEFTVQRYINIINDFKAEHPDDFSGAKLIMSSWRCPENRTRISLDINETIMLRQKYPQYIAGYDMVSQEDRGGPLLFYINELLSPRQQGVDLPFFFHASETNWQGTFVDGNIIDAILLNSSRIGHGYVINKHPVAMEMMKERDIPIELNPISNQVLSLVSDLRNHVGASLIAESFPLVVSSDNTASWGALPLSHDYYMAFMGMSGQETGLTLLKQLALNTFKYSAMTVEEKEDALRLWQAKWDIFIDKILSKYDNHLLHDNGKGNPDQHAEL